MSGYLFDWASLLVRWLHVITGIAWIGASFYFVWLDNHLLPVAGPQGGELAGELWAVHGGGFYRAVKYRVAPAALPKTLHWFYWEAYTTWLSGFTLLCLLYFVRAEAYLIDPGVRALSKPLAIALALGLMAATWLIYDALCRSPLKRRGGVLGAALTVLFAALAYVLCHLFSGRGAFLVFGSALGTVMVANVYFVIIPGQRELVRAKAEQRTPDPETGLRGKLRSVHNTYLTLPVLFVMISHHYPMTFGASQNWAVLIAMSLAGAGIRTWFVARHRGNERQPLMLVTAAASVLIIAGLAAVLVPRAPEGSSAASSPGPAERAHVQLILTQRCAPCHAAHPTLAGFTTPPNGVLLDSLEQLMQHLPQVQQQLATRAMPLGNLTGMTPGEREELLNWVTRAAPLAQAAPP